MAPPLVHCLLCDCSTLEESLAEHIQYNHMVYRKTLRQVLYSLHFPPVDAALLDLLGAECRSESTLSPRNHNNMSPFTRRKRSISKDSGKGKRRKESPYAQAKRQKVQQTPPQTPAKKPIVLKKPTPARKRLQPTLSGMLEDPADEEGDENPPANGRKSRNKSGEVDYNAVYTRRENSEKATNNMKKIRQLQQNELQCTMDQGTYVQCCECSKWRMVREYEDPALVPEYWVCSMNMDETINACTKGEGDDVESDEEFVSVEFTCGSMVWVKFPGYPWWPGMVDYCPEKEDTFLVDERVNSRVAASYHVVFFDRAQHVARAWVNKDGVVKMVSVEEPPRAQQAFKNDGIKKRFQQAKEMAVDALGLPRIERIEKYSFVSLYAGKWAGASEEEEDFERRNTEIDVDARLVGVSDFRQPETPGKKKPEPRKIRKRKKSLKEKRFLVSDQKAGSELGWEAEPNFRCCRCQSDVKFSRSFVTNHLRKHRLDLQEYLTKYEGESSPEQLHRLRQWLQSQEYLSRISETARERRRSQEGAPSGRSSVAESATSGRTSVEDGRSGRESVDDTKSGRTSVEDVASERESTEAEGQTEVDDLLAEDDEHADEGHLSEEEIPIEIPFDDDDVSRDRVGAAAEAGEIETKPEPIELGDMLERVPVDGLAAVERQSTVEREGTDERESTDERENTEESPSSVERRSTRERRGAGEEDGLDSMDSLRRHLELLESKRRPPATEARPLRKTGEPAAEEGEGGEEAVVKEEPMTWYNKPPMSPELLIAIAVRNLDPHKEVGASCSDIVAFISLHFPYFNNNYEECKDMVRRECGMSSSFESGRENFQMRAEINCGDRIHSYVQNNRDRICQSMLEPLFLDVVIDRFVAEDSMVSPASRRSPPFSREQLTHLALLKLPQRATLEQIVIVLKFIFPALATTGVMEAFRKEFLEVIAKTKELDAKVERNNITFRLREEHREEVLGGIRQVALASLDTIGESLLHENFFDIILPIFQNSD